MQEGYLNSPKNSLRRDLSFWHACALVIGSMIGTGIFFFVSPVAQYLSDPKLILAAWTTGVVIAFSGAISLSELSAAYPNTGGIYVYLSRAYGPFVGFLYSWIKFFMLRIGSLAIPALAFAGFFNEFFEVYPSVGLEIQKPLAIIVVISLTMVNALGVKFGGRVQGLLSILKIACLFFLVAVGLLYMNGILKPYEFENLSEVFEASTRSIHVSNSVAMNFLSALVPILWTLGGWDEPPFVAGEIQSPRRNLPLSILIGTLLVGGLYIAVNASYLAILSPSELAASGGKTAIVAMRRVLGPGSAQMVALFLMISCLGVLNAMIMTGARIAFAAGQDHALFRWFNETHPVTKTPQKSLLVQGILTCLVIIFSEDMLSVLLFTGLPYWLFSGLMAVSVIVLRCKHKNHQRPFMVWGYPWVPGIFAFSSLAMAVAILNKNFHYLYLTILMVAIGALLFLGQKHLLGPKIPVSVPREET